MAPAPQIRASNCRNQHPKIHLGGAGSALPDPLGGGEALPLFPRSVTVQEVQRSEPARDPASRLLIQTFGFVNVLRTGYAAASNREHALSNILRIVFQKARVLEGPQVHSGMVSFLPCSPPSES